MEQVNRWSGETIEDANDPLVVRWWGDSWVNVRIADPAAQ